MEAKRVASQTPSLAKTPTDDKRAENIEAIVTESSVQDGTPANTEVSLVITDEVRIRSLTDEKPKPSKLHTISHNPLVSVVVGFLLTALIGTYLTYLYTRRLQELEDERSFAAELNKVRIQKIGEVWEQIDKNEPVLDGLLENANRTSSTNKEAFDKISKIVDEDIAIINRNRFWLGEPAYKQLKDYLDITGQYVSDMLLGRPGIDLSETLKRREQAKHDVLQIRSMFLKGEPEPGK